MFADQAKTLAWFLQRPRLYPQLIHLAARKLSRAHYSSNATRDEATAWCAERAIDSAAAIERLTGSRPAAPVERLFPDLVATGAKRVRECPTWMGGPGDMNLLYSITEHLKAERVIETGVAYGWSSLAILLSLENRPASRLISTDMPVPNARGEEYVGCVVPSEMRWQWSILKWADRQALPRALRELGILDMCHYDSDKSYEGRMWAYPLLWKALRPGGAFISDDIGDNFAFRDFAAATESDPVVVEMREQAGIKYVGTLVKPTMGGRDRLATAPLLIASPNP